ncbi:MAG: arginine deiminase family protein [Rhodospirillaceae bacterium]|nr:arginine deiminase family protein [Rhodospirillaceae bacterium]
MNVQQRSFNEYGTLARVALRHPREAFVDDARIDEEWQALNYTARPDLACAIDEFDRFAAILAGMGATIDYLPAAPGLTIDSLYVRDAALETPKGLVLCNMGKPARQGEPAIHGTALGAAGVSVLGRIEAPGRIEGGDLVWFDAHTLAVARGYRTNDDGISQLADLVGKEVEIVTVPLPHYRGPSDVFHLMSILSPIDHDLALVYSPLMPVPFREWLIDRGIALVEVPDAEFDNMGCNVLAIAPRRCVMLEGNPETRRRLEAAGAEVIAIPGREISEKGQGGPTCLTRPLVRT